ncbi:MAG: hemerythrin domain-containing protein [Actinobacteria bacterium]|nr:hemerythrin domain-containing protein [Actinomycetota bacterium]
MDVIEHLIQEHRKAEQLMDRLQDTDPGTRRDQLVAELTDALATHMAIEEQYLYPIVSEVLGQKTETEAETEHGLARDGLAQLDELHAAPGFGAALDMVKAGIAHHVHEEEHEVFPQLLEKAAERLETLDPNELEAQVNKGRRPDVDLTKDELYRQAQAAEIPGRSAMTKDELAQAVAYTP